MERSYSSYSTRINNENSLMASNMSSETKAFAISTLFGFFIITMSVLIAFAPRHNQSIAVIVPPWSDSNHIIKVIGNAGGVIKTQDRNGWVAISQNDNPDIVRRLYKAGAVLVIDASLISACFSYNV